jgi:hypothetical protein
MSRRPVALVALAAVALLGVAPSEAAAPKKKKPDWKGSYELTLYPDPTESVLPLLADGCNGVLATGHDKRQFTVPAAGKLTVNLVSPDPTGRGVTDWDMYLMASEGSTAGAVTGPPDTIAYGAGSTSNEQAIATFKKKTTFSLQVCNLVGNTKGKVSWVFKYA